MSLFFTIAENSNSNFVDNSFETQKTLSPNLLSKNNSLEDKLYIHEKKYKQCNDKLKISSRTYFKHRNLIKKVKTNCINIYEKLINSCLFIEQPFFQLIIQEIKEKEMF